MDPFTIIAIVLAAVQIFQAWRQRRHGQAIRELRLDANTDKARRAMAPGRGGDDPGRLLPEARQLLHDLDLDAVAAKPVIDNLTAITFSLRTVCAKLESLVSNPQLPSAVAEQFTIPRRGD